MVVASSVSRFDGTTRTNMDAPTASLFQNEIHGTSATNVWIGGFRSRVHRWDGEQWITLGSPDENRELTDLWVVSETEAWAVIDSPALYHYLDGAWSLEPVESAAAVTVDSAGTVWVGTGSGVLRRTSSSPSWESGGLDGIYVSHIRAATNVIYAIAKSTVQALIGEVWTELGETQPGPFSSVSAEDQWGDDNALWVVVSNRRDRFAVP